MLQLDIDTLLKRRNNKIRMHLNNALLIKCVYISLLEVISISALRWHTLPGVLSAVLACRAGWTELLRQVCQGVNISAGDKNCLPCLPCLPLHAPWQEPVVIVIRCGNREQSVSNCTGERACWRQHSDA